MRRDIAIHQGLEQPSRTINTVACEPLGTQTKAAFDPVNHGLGDCDLFDAVGACALGIDDDPSLVVDEIVCIVGKERIDAHPCDLGRLWIGQRDLLRRLASSTATARTTTGSTILLICAGSIESHKILANRTRSLLSLRPGDRL